jgi:2-polyprenyl-3-methyl-5-hydroxy-6-metoxy-1,4-benzoquinol methylase
MEYDKSRNTPKLMRTKWGFYQFHPLPSNNELKQYYEKKYYQEAKKNYEISYSNEELEWFELKNWLIYEKTHQLLGPGKKKCIDIGCGEGWLMAEFMKRGHSVKGIDYSRFGIAKFNPHLINFFEQTDIFSFLEKNFNQKQRYDIIALCNVIEHIKNPVALLKKIKNLMQHDSVLVIVAPNDFSPLHTHLEKKKLVYSSWFIRYPDHLSYFNKESMCNLLSDSGYDVKAVLADNPIDLNLLNGNSNYVIDKEKGKNTHLFRVRTDNFLGTINRHKLLALYEIFGSMGVGRNLTYYGFLK